MTRFEDESEGRRRRRAAGLLFGAIVLVFVTLAGRLLHINLSMSPQLLAVAASQQERAVVLPARRGFIFDARGRVLAGSRTLHSVFADPALIDRPDETARLLAPILGMEAGPIENEIRIASTPRFCWLKRRIDDAQAEAIKHVHCPGIGLVPEFERYWPMGQTAAHVLGFVGVDDVGLEGVEAMFDKHLRGVDGRRMVLCDARRRAIGPGSIDNVAPVDGGHLVLTIDAIIQRMVESRLLEQVEQHGAESGVAVVMSPKTGDVLALACVPTFEPAQYADYDADARRDRVITDPVEPGSTFKPFVMAGALEGRYVQPDERIDTHNGVYSFGSRLMHDSHAHGVLTAREIIIYSSNIGMGIISTRMGNPALHEIITRFGFGSTTQIGLPGESPGIVLPVRQWTTYSTTSVSMGQELAVTPIQLATGLCAIVNGGVLLRPRIVRATMSADGELVDAYQGPEIIRRVLTEDLSHQLTREFLAEVVKHGGKELDASPYTMAGKTGTAQVPYKNRRGYEPDAFVSSFMGAAPVDDPEVVVVVMLRKPDPKYGHFGRVVSGPAVRDIVKATLEYLQVPPSEEVEAPAE